MKSSKHDKKGKKGKKGKHRKKRKGEDEESEDEDAAAHQVSCVVEMPEVKDLMSITEEIKTKGDN